MRIVIATDDLENARAALLQTQAHAEGFAAARAHARRADHGPSPAWPAAADAGVA